MKTIILDASKEENIDLCAIAIKTGQLVAVPTETVYGLAANALDLKAVSKIFEVKERQPDNPLIVHVASISEVYPLVSEIPETFEVLAKNFWPGALTLIMKKHDCIPGNVSAGLDTVAIRIPNHPATISLIRKSGCPLAAPSANLSGSPSPTKAIHVKDDIDSKIPYILDGGDCKVGVESTVLDISGALPKILRPGGVTFDELCKILGTVRLGSGAAPDSPKSPGMKYRHYAPKVPLTAIIGPPDKTAAYIKKKICDNTAALMFDDFAFEHQNIILYGRSEDYAAQAANLFDALRAFDNMDVSSIYAQVPLENGLGLAISNRIKKASSNSIIDLSK